MPPTGQPTIDFSNVNDQDLSQMLKDYGFDVGPVNAATRKTYERKLVQLKTGSLPPSSQTPVDDDDDDDEEVQTRQPEPQTRRPEPLRPIQDLSESTYSYGSSVSDSSFSASRSYTYPRHTDVSPDVRSRPSLPADRQTPSSYSTPLRRPVPTKVSSKEKGNSIPLWLKLVAVAIAVILIYLIYINMEPAAVSSIPEIQQKMEV